MRTEFWHVTVLTGVLALGMAPDLAKAQGPPPDPARRAELVRRFDANGDGQLSPAEIEAARATNTGPTGSPPTPSSATDKPQPPALTNDAQVEGVLRQFDRNGDGKLDYAEMDALRLFMKTTARTGTDRGPASPPGEPAGETRQKRQAARPGAAHD